MMAVVTGIAVAAGVTTAVLVMSDGSDGKPPDVTATGPIAGSVHTIRLRTSGRAAGIQAQRTAPFSMLGVVWNAPDANLAGSVRVRTRSASTGRWSEWRPVTVAEDDLPDGIRREHSHLGATSPLWTGPSNGVDVRVAGERTLPAGMRVALIDPGDRRHPPVRAAGREPARAALAADTIEPSTPPADSPSATAPSPEPATPPADTPSVTPAVQERWSHSREFRAGRAERGGERRSAPADRLARGLGRR
jgi:hypothetical protein